MRMRKLFAGLAAAATLLGGLSLGVNSAFADETAPSEPTEQSTVTDSQTTESNTAANDATNVEANQEGAKVADAPGASTLDTENTVPAGTAWPTADDEYPVTGTSLIIKASTKEQLANRTFRLYKIADYIYYKGSESIGVQTVGSDKTTAAYKAVQKAMAQATKGNDSANRYATDPDDPSTYLSDDPMAWAAQPETKTGDDGKPVDPESNGRIDIEKTSPWTGLTRQLAQAFDLNDFATGSDKTHNGTGTDSGKAFDYYDRQIKNQEPTEHKAESGVTGSEDYWYIQIDNLTRGLYFVVDATANTNNAWTNSLRMIVGTKLKIKVDGNPKDLSDGVVNLKNQTLPIHKEVVKKNQNNNSFVSNEAPDYGIGDTIYYRLTTQVPTYSGYAKNADYPYSDLYIDNNDQSLPTNRRSLSVMDTMSKGLTYAGIESVTVTPADSGQSAIALQEEVLDNPDTSNNEYSANDYEVSTAELPSYTPAFAGSNQVPDSAKTGTSTKITIDLGGYVNQAKGAQSFGKAIAEGGTVTVVIKAILNKNAIVATPDSLNGNPNKVDLEYSNNPDNMQDKTTVPGGEVNVYTFKFQIVKVDKETQKPLQYAKFIVLGPSGYLKQYSDDSGWEYTTDKNEAREFVTNPDGVIEALSGLDAGEYTVTEVTPPAGYQNVILPSFSFTITATYKQDAVTKPVDANLWGDHTITKVEYGAPTDDTWKLVSQGNEDVPQFQYTVSNVKNVTQLPLTGGMGIALFGTIGLIIAGGAVAVFLRSRKTKMALMMA